MTTDRVQRSPATASIVAHGSLTYVATVGLTLAALGLSRLAFNIVGNQQFGVSIVGRANILLSIALLVGLPASTGLAMAVSRFVPIYGDTSATESAVRTALILTLLSVSLVWGLTLLFAGSRWGIEASSVEIAVATAWTILYAVYAIGRALLFALGRVGSALLLELSGLGLFATALILSASRHGAWWLALSLYPVPIVAFTLVRTLRSRSPFHFPDRERFVRFAALALLGSAAAQGIQYGSTLIGGSTGGASLAGIWATLVSLASPALLLPRSLSTSYLPRLSALGSVAGDGFQRTSREHQRLAAILALPASSGLLVVGTLLLPTAIPGPIGRQVYISWDLLCAVTYVTCRSEPILTGIAALGRAGINASAALIGGTLCIATWMIALRVVPGVVALVIGLLVFAIAAPAISSLIAIRRNLEHRPRLIFLPGDFAMALLVVLTAWRWQERRFLALALLVASAGITVELWRYRRRRRGDSQ